MNLKVELNEERFLRLLEKLVSEGEYLQNQPPHFVAREDLAGRHVLEALRPHSQECGGPLVVKHISYAEGRGNIIIQYPSSDPDASTIAFVGSHLDVVVADKKTWKRNPFKLEIDGDTLHGRGTTDCLGHVALLTDLFIQLAETRPRLQRTIAGVIIVDEEAGGSRDDADIGVGRLMEEGELSFLRKGPVIWLDCADKQPNIGSGGTVQWKLTTNGKLFHSGFPHKGVNAVELAMDIVNALQQHFYKKFPPHEKEKEYGFECSSSFKPTVIETGEGSVNQIPVTAIVRGDIRLIPFYDIHEAMQEIEKKLRSIIDCSFEELPKRGPDSRYITADGTKGKVELEWTCEPIKGLACSLDSLGFKALASATKEILGFVQPLADTGSLPLVGDLKASGYDIQTVGYGVEDAYHAENEFARLSDFRDGMKVLSRLIEIVEADNS